MEIWAWSALRVLGFGIALAALGVYVGLLWAWMRKEDLTPGPSPSDQPSRR